MLRQLIASARHLGDLSGVASEVNRLLIGCACLLIAPQPTQQVGARGVISVVAGQRLLKSVDSSQRHLRTFELGDGYGPVEDDDRRGVDTDQLVVEGDDLGPVGIAYVAGEGMHRVDRGENLVSTRCFARHGSGEAFTYQSMALGDERRVPDAAILCIKGDQIATG